LCIFTLSLFSPLGEELSPSLERIWIPSPKNDLCQVWLKLAQWFWRRSPKCKSLQTDRQTDTGQRAIRKAHLSFQLRWAKKKQPQNIVIREWVNMHTSNASNVQV
jgi:hypothetical protein